MKIFVNFSLFCETNPWQFAKNTPCPLWGDTEILYEVIIGELRMTSLTSDDNRGGVPGGGAPWSPQWSATHNVSVSRGPGWVSHTILGKLFTRIMIMGLARIQDKPLQLIVFFSGALIVQSAASCCHCPILCWFGFPGGWETVTDENPEIMTGRIINHYITMATFSRC